MRQFLLRALVHIEALLCSPLAYLQGVGWRLRGLKVRSRHRLSLLLGKTPHAYQLWMASREREQLSNFSRACDGERLASPPMLVVVDGRQNACGLADTIASLDQLENESIEYAILGQPGNYSQLGLVFPQPQDLTQWIIDATGKARRWIISIKAGDRLCPLAPRIYRSALSRTPEATVLYSDDDLIDPSGRRHSPHFKPSWNAELARHLDFVSDSCMFACDPLRIGPDWPRGALDFESADPVHVPYFLHHRQSRLEPDQLALSPAPAELPHVSVIVPTRDHCELLRTCMEGLQATNYPAFDITVIDNGSSEEETLAYLAQLQSEGVRIEQHAGPFNYAAMHNAVVPMVRGPFVCLLNNDIEVVDGNWLSWMVARALSEDVGAVGARLLYPDRTIQHAGIVLGVGGGAGHAHRNQPDDAQGYFGRAHLPQFVSAVTAACLVLRKDRFNAVGGFDADNFPVAFNDVDLCMKLRARGWHNLYEPRARLIHHESKSRGLDQDDEKRRRFASELDALKRLWSTDAVIDPYHHPELSQFGEQFVPRL